jgi:hypothetical protein
VTVPCLRHRRERGLRATAESDLGGPANRNSALASRRCHGTRLAHQAHQLPSSILISTSLKPPFLSCTHVRLKAMLDFSLFFLKTRPRMLVHQAYRLRQPFAEVLVDSSPTLRFPFTSCHRYHARHFVNTVNSDHTKPLP